MKKVSAEDIYSIWRQEIFRLKDVHVRPMKNFENARSKEEWKYFELCANLINRNDGVIDSKLYVKSLVDFFKRYIPPKILISRKAILIYKNFKDKRNKEESLEFVEKSIKDSLRFISKYCISNNLNSLDEYLEDGKNVFPTIVKHMHAGSLSYYFIAANERLFFKIKENCPSDIYEEFCKDFEQNFHYYRTKWIALSSKKFNSLESDLSYIIQQLILKGRSNDTNS